MTRPIISEEMLRSAVRAGFDAAAARWEAENPVLARFLRGLDDIKEQAGGSKFLDYTANKRPDDGTTLLEITIPLNDYPVGYLDIAPDGRITGYVSGVNEEHENPQPADIDKILKRIADQVINPVALAVIEGFDLIKEQAGPGGTFGCEISRGGLSSDSILLYTTIPLGNDMKLFVDVARDGKITTNPTGQYEEIENPQAADIAGVIKTIADMAAACHQVYPARTEPGQSNHILTDQVQRTPRIGGLRT